MTKIMLVISEDWFFLSHRRALAEACLAAGWQVVVATHITDRAEIIRQAGFILEPLPLERGGLNPWRELRCVIRLAAVLLRHRPDILHSVALKPLLYANLPALFLGPRARVSAIAGLGYAFTGRDLARRALKAGLELALRLVLRRPGSAVIVQNDDDRRQICDRGLAAPGQITLIPGSGVDLQQWPALPPPEGQPVIFALVARMLADKGVVEAVEAVRLLKAQGVMVRLWLVGGTDPQNPTSLSEERLRAWQAEGLVEWLGQQSDILGIWRQAHVAVLPSYREGMPRTLLEAAACARPIITTDVPGCRQVIDDGVEGILVPAREAAGLAAAMARLAGDGDLRLAMGRAARVRAEARFGVEAVIAAHMALYRQLLGG